MLKKARKKVNYTVAEKEQAKRLFSEFGYTPSQVAEKIGCSSETARKWKIKYVQTLSPDEAAALAETDEENKRLRKENAKLKLEVEIFKKAAAYFARESM
jgi:transposase-like protein